MRGVCVVTQRSICQHVWGHRLHCARLRRGQLLYLADGFFPAAARLQQVRGSRERRPCGSGAVALFVFRAAGAAYGNFQARGRIGVLLPAYTTATATRHLSHVSDLYHSSWQCQILKPLSEARDRPQILMDTS